MAGVVKPEVANQKWDVSCGQLCVWGSVWLSAIGPNSEVGTQIRETISHSVKSWSFRANYSGSYRSASRIIAGESNLMLTSLIIDSTQALGPGECV